MLIKDVVQGYGGRVEFVSENWGESKLAERYGVKRYPAVFVDDILIANPNDFGGWSDLKGGKYTPWKDQANHEKFKKDLTRMIDLILKGQKTLAAAEGRTHTVEEAEISTLPTFQVRDLQGRQIDSASLTGRIVVVEFWATWCPPCRTTLGWLGELKRRYGDRVTILAVAVESEEAQVRELTGPLNLPINIVMASEQIVLPFGSLGSVPRMFIFDQKGKTTGVFYGATPDLHEKVSRLISSMADQPATTESVLKKPREGRQIVAHGVSRGNSYR